jgi:hypothetical protein
MTARLARRGGDNNPINSTTRDELSEGVLEKINDFNVASGFATFGGAEDARPPTLPRLRGQRSSQHVHGSNPTAVTSRKTGLARVSKGVHEARSGGHVRRHRN